MNTPTLAESMADLLSTVTAFFTSILSMVSSLITTITGNAYLMVGFCIVVASFAIGVLVRVVGKLGHSAR